MNSAVSYHSSQMSLHTVHRCAVQLESVKVVGNVTYRMAGNNSLHNKTSLCASYINNIVIIFCYVVFIHFLEFLVLGIFGRNFCAQNSVKRTWCFGKSVKTTGT